ncbi:MAG: hypothetical protein CL666_01110 [Balneola sp.]|nr:hypothetical protein [Balneola sp.]|tara:strand:- start:45718 stop:47160 length:1443 start_codon:yes stop_codon:yes gene_type:complete
MLETFFEGNYWFSRFLLQRSLGAIYLIAFLNALTQFRPLMGEKGLMPAPHLLKRISFKRKPSIFHWYYSDQFFGIIAWIGVALSIIALFGISESGPIWFSMLVWFTLWLLYQSIVNIGYPFYGFGWESMLLEAGFFAIFLGPFDMAVPVLVIWMFCWMLFRVEFGAGLIKMRGDQCWRELTCLNYHHETQPLPNPLSRFFHLMPESYHKMETGFNHFVQLVVVWGLFFPQPVASIAAGVIILSQFYLIISGNYAWLNWLTLSLGFSALSDGVITQLTGLAPPETASIPLVYNGIVVLLAVIVLIMSIKPTQNMLSKNQKMNFNYNPLHLVNTYGAFGSVTKTRNEIIIEGTTDENISEDTEWRSYEFKGKPGDPSQRPPQVSPGHYRLDWQMWFAAMGSYQNNPWFITLLRKLLENDEATLKLLKNDPFSGTSPKYIRSRLYQYEFTSREEYKKTGNWWKRRLVEEYTRPVSRKDLGTRN